MMSKEEKRREDVSRMLISSNVTARGIDVQQAGMVFDVFKISGLQYWFIETYLPIAWAYSQRITGRLLESVRASLMHQLGYLYIGQIMSVTLDLAPPPSYFRIIVIVIIIIIIVIMIIKIVIIITIIIIKLLIIVLINSNRWNATMT